MTPQKFSDILLAAHDMHKASNAKMVYTFISASRDEDLTDCTAYTCIEALKDHPAAKAIVLRDFEFMALIEGPDNTFGHVLLFEDMSFFVFDQTQALDTELRGDMSYADIEFDDLRPTQDMKVAAASKPVLAKTLEVVDEVEGAGFRNELCEAVHDAHDPIIEPEDYDVHENWSTETQSDIEKWVMLTAAALKLPEQVNILVTASYRDAVAEVQLMQMDYTLPGLTALPYSLMSRFFTDVLELTTGLSEFEGGSYEYADGAHDRKSGYAAVPATVFNGSFDHNTISNHERLQSRSIFIKELERADLAGGDASRLLKSLEEIEEKCGNINND